MKSFDENLEVYSAGTQPTSQVHPKAIHVMKEVNIDISKRNPENVQKYLDEPFDYVITVCGSAKESCPVFTGKVKQRLHIGFDDPADATGSENEILSIFRKVRDEIRRDFNSFFLKHL